MLTNASDLNDVTSVILSKMSLKALTAAVLNAGGNWAIRFPSIEILRLNVVLKGDCWLSIDGEKNKHHLQAGDCFLQPLGKSFTLSKDLSVKNKIYYAEKLVINAKNGVITCGCGGDILVGGSAFQFEGHFPKIIFGRLPAVIHIPANLDQAAVLRWSLERFAAELQNKNAGRSLMLNQLATIMLLQTLRVYTGFSKDENNWVTALADPKLYLAIEAMHSNYKKNWTVDELASLVGVSRAGFALSFKKRIGLAPMEYFKNWRMQIACELLETGKLSITEIANAVGYDSESAFSVAFKRIVKCRPGAYQKNMGSR